MTGQAGQRPASRVAVLRAGEVVAIEAPAALCRRVGVERLALLGEEAA